MENFNPFDFDDVMRFFQEQNKKLYGISTQGTTPKIEELTIQELTLSEMIGTPVKIKKQ